jgi:3',5'-nucleoside bisphosphate phosphatase
MRFWGPDSEGGSGSVAQRAEEPTETPAPADEGADLHLHTTRSDGRLSPAEVVRRAAAAGVRVLAVTDHDTTGGVEEAMAEAARLGIRCLPGVEVGVQAFGADIHLLAYFVDPRGAGLQDLLAELRRAREERLVAMARRLRLLGFPVTLAEVRRHVSPGGPVGRPHLAAALVARGWVEDVDEAFRWYLGSGGPAYLPNRTPTPETVLRTLLASGAVPVLAHPGSAPSEAVFERFLAAGLMGLEVHHPRHDAATTARWGAVAAAHGLLQTGGSDYHGYGRDLPPGSVRAPAGAVARLDAARREVPQVLEKLHG